jgi:hypothetical protein
MQTMSSCDKLGCMKIKGISELISALAIGAICVLFSNGMHQKWHRLGREAFLAHQSQNFDKLYANPASLMHLVLIWVVIVLPIFVLYKGIAFVVAKVLSSMTDKDETAQG